MPASSLAATVKQEFKFSRLHLSHERPVDFRTSQWTGLNGIPFLMIRLTLLAYAVASFITAAVTIASRDRNETWVTYMTSVNHIVVTVYISSCALQSTMHIWWSRGHDSSLENASKGHGKSRKFQIYTKIHWLIFNVASNVCFFVFFAYWCFVSSDDQEFKDGRSSTIRYMTIDRHGINLFVLFLDFALSKTPVRLLHFVYPSCFIALYFISNCIYWASTGNLVYGPILDYSRNTGKAVAMVLAAVFITTPVIQLIWFCLYILRRRLSRSEASGTETTYDLAAVEANPEDS